MIGFVSIAAVSATLSYSAVMGYNQPINKLEAAASGKYQDRVLPTDEAPHVHGTSVASVSLAGGSDATGKGDRLTRQRDQPAQFVTVETRSGLNTSILVRVPQIDVAQR